MTTHKTSELAGALLDAAVAKAEGHTEIELDEVARKLVCQVVLPGEDGQHYWTEYSPSTDWREAGPIIERERIAIEPHMMRDNEWVANRDEDAYDPGWSDCECEWRGPTALVAAMRAYVGAKLGRSVELPG